MVEALLGERRQAKRIRRFEERMTQTTWITKERERESLV